ncbi:PAS domain-containing protein [Marinobacter sp.]|uniref:PAS domain-containing protein n=1 Tax=Marinobacter sp. TaxID=50741 RepID=UPI00356412BB
MSDRSTTEHSAYLGQDEAARLKTILEGTRAGTWEWNVQTGETVFNERWARIIGYTLEELQPVSIETWLKFAHPDDLAESEKRLQAHFRVRRTTTNAKPACVTGMATGSGCGIMVAW